jgi:hypothetical protein
MAGKICPVVQSLAAGLHGLCNTEVSSRRPALCPRKYMQTRKNEKAAGRE